MSEATADMPSRLFCCFGSNINEDGISEKETSKGNIKELTRLPPNSSKLVSAQNVKRNQFTDMGDVEKVINIL